MSINSVRNRRNHNGLSAEAVIQTLKFTTNQPIEPFSPTVGRRGKPFKDVDTNEKYYNYYVPPTSAPLPTGLVLNQRTGEITGTPTTNTIVDETHFSISVTIAVKDSLNHVAYKKSIIDFVIVDPFVVQEKTLSYNGKVNKLEVNDDLYVSVVGGRPPYVYAVSQGTLPAGVKINQQTGKLIGKPTATKRTYIDETQVEELPLEDPITITVTDFYNTVVSNITTVNFNIEDVIIAVPNANVPIRGNIPLSVYFLGFNSVTLGTAPYVYFTPDTQKDSLPAGVELNPETGAISGIYNGATDYKGTLQIAVRDQEDNIASKVAEIDIEACIPLTAVTNHVDGAGTAITVYNFVATKAINHTPLKALHGIKPYVFTLWYCTYIDKQENVTHYDSGIPGVEISGTDGTITATNGLLAGTYIFGFKVADDLGNIIDTAPSFMYLVSDAIYATVLTDNTDYQIYVNDQSSNLNVGFTVLRAELGIPPYTFEVSPKLPDGLTFNTTATTCSIVGSPTKSGQTTCEFKVKDSTGMYATNKHTIIFNVADILTTSADDLEIIHVLGEPAADVDIFETIKGGFPPYTCTLMFGQIPYEYTFKGDPFTVISATGSALTISKPKLWGNDWVDAPGGFTKGSTKTFGELGTYISYYQVSDSKGAVSANRARVQFTIVTPIDAVSNNVAKITGDANVTHVNFKPIRITGGVPPYKLKIATTRTNPDTNVEERFPTLGLRVYQPDTITGIPNNGYQGKMYFYVTDSHGGASAKFPVEFDISAELIGEKLATDPLIMCVQEMPYYEIIHDVNGSTVIEKVTELNIPLFKSVTGGLLPYTYFQSTDAGKVVSTDNSLPRNFYIHPTTGNLIGNSMKTDPAANKKYYCTVADINNNKSKPTSFFLRVNAPLITEQYNNVLYNSSFESADGTKSNSKLVKVVDDTVAGFKISVGKYGSGRYLYQLRFYYGEADFYQNFKFDPVDGQITTIDSSSKVKFPADIKMSVNVQDKFTGWVVYSPDILEIKIYPRLYLSRNPAVVPRLRLWRGKIITNDEFKPIIITGGSGHYVVTVTPPLPGGLDIDNLGNFVNAPDHLVTERVYTVRVDDALFTGVTGQKDFNMIVESPIVDIDVDSGANKSLNISFLQAKSNMSVDEIINVPMIITVNILGTQASGTPLAPAFTLDWGILHPDTTVLIDIKGGDGIIGAGGANGVYSAASKLPRDGKPGGPGLKLNLGQATGTIKGNGRMVAGGGGGGGAGGFDWIVISLMKASRYLAEESFSMDRKSWKITSYSASFIMDGANEPISNGFWKSKPSVVSDTSVEGGYLYAVAKDPSPLAKAKPQVPGKAKPAVTMNGAAGGRGAGDNKGATPGDPGVKSPISPAMKKPAASSMPSEATFDKADKGAGMLGTFKRPTPTMTLDYPGDISFGDRTPAQDGEGPFAGLAGEDLYCWEGVLYGCAGGGGGGFGGKGGDGGYSSPAPATSPTAKRVMIPGGFGGAGGLAIDASDCFIDPVILPSTNVYGEIKKYVEPPEPTPPK